MPAALSGSDDRFITGKHRSKLHQLKFREKKLKLLGQRVIPSSSVLGSNTCTRVMIRPRRLQFELQFPAAADGRSDVAGLALAAGRRNGETRSKELPGWEINWGKREACGVRT